MKKSPDAFRTISEVADWLDVPAHVLRFWESRFAQIKPVKRAGGRRYYRPNDMLLIGGIKKLLHDDGMTIRGVQKLLREEGVRHVSALSRPLDEFGGEDAIDVSPPEVPPEAEGESEVIQIVREAADRAAPAPRFGSVRRDQPMLPFDLDDIDPPAPAAEVPPAPSQDAIVEPAAADAEPGVPVSPSTPKADAAATATSFRTGSGKIPPTPLVPLVDPEDDAPRHSGPPSRVARLVTIHDHLSAEPERLQPIADSLRDIRDRLTD